MLRFSGSPGEVQQTCRKRKPVFTAAAFSKLSAILRKKRETLRRPYRKAWWRQLNRFGIQEFSYKVPHINDPLGLPYDTGAHPQNLELSDGEVIQAQSTQRFAIFLTASSYYMLEPGTVLGI